MNWKECRKALVANPAFSRRDSKTTENVSQDNRCFDTDSNRKLPNHCQLDFYYIISDVVLHLHRFHLIINVDSSISEFGGISLSH
jgi:hypothetical protein